MKWLVVACVAIFTLFTPLCSQAAQLEIRPTAQLPQVLVKENFVQLATAKLENVLQENGETRRHEIRATNVPAGTRLPAGRIDYELIIPNGIRYGNRTQVWINIKINGKHYTQIRCVMQILVYEKMLTAARQIQPETPITSADLRLEEREIGVNNYKYFTKLEDVLGKVTARAVSEGKVLYKHNIGEPNVIEPGNPVTIKALVNGIEIETEGISKSKGRIGQSIRVQNLSSGRIIMAKVIDANTVSIVK